MSGKLPLELGAFIRSARNAAGFSTLELDRQLFVKNPPKRGKKRKLAGTGSMIRMWESGHASPTVQHLPLLAKALCVSLPDLWVLYRHHLIERLGLKILDFEPHDTVLPKVPSVILVNWGAGEIQIKD